MNVHPADLSRIAEARDAILAALHGDEDAVALRDTLHMTTDLMDLMDALLARHAFDRGMVVGLEATIAEAKTRLTRVSQRIEAERDGLLALALASGLRSIERPLATVSVTPGRESLRLSDDFECPTQLLKRPPPEPDTAAIKAALKAGETIPGASLARGAPSVRIGSK